MVAGEFHSRFGGMWIDRHGWQEELARRVQSRQIPKTEADQLRRFVEDGYIILPQAASVRHIDAFQQRIARGFAEGNPNLRYQAHGSQQTKALDGPVDRLGSRVVDSFVALPQALDLFASAPLLRFLTLIFGEDPLLFQSLSFDQGSQQGLHQDTAYVVVDRPMELAACWIALEDVTPGSGELIDLPGSHRYPDYDFGYGEKHWRGGPAEQPAHEAWSRWLIAEGERRGLKQGAFLARKGDVLVWHADLAHGGAPVTNPSSTRRSLVGHFCPVSARPRYFDHGPKRDATLRYRGLNYASEHYDLAAIKPMERSWMDRLFRRAS